MFQIFRTINFLHKKNIIHGDIKSENILYNGKIIKIIDFGNSKNLHNQNITKNSKNDVILDLLGTVLYTAPEVLSNTCKDEKKTDIWSCGIIFFILVTGTNPFDCDDCELVNVITSLDLKEKIKNIGMSESLKNLLMMVLERNPEKRFSSDMVLNDPFFKNLKIKKKIDDFFFLRIFENNFVNKIEKYILLFFIENFLDEKEFLKIGEYFNEIDFDFKGFLEPKDFFIIFEKYKKKISEEKILEIFSKFCLEKNKMTFTELIICCYNKKNLLIKKNIFTVFQIFDFDKKGKIGFKDLNIIFEEINIFENDWKNFISEKKFEEDGFIDFEDFEFLLEKI